MKQKKPFSLIPEKRLLALYQAMLKCRALAPKSKAGDEALHCAVALHLAKEDRLMADANATTLRHLKGEPLMRLLRGAPADVKHGFYPLPAPKTTAAEQLYYAAGVAMAAKAPHPEQVTILFLEGKHCAGREWEQALRFVAAQGLGLIIVCDGAAQAGKNGRKLMEEPGSRSAVKGLPPVLQVDRGDAIAVYRVAQEAMTHAREYQRPTILRAYGAREIGPLDPHAAFDPIRRMEEYLRSKRIAYDAVKASVRQGIGNKLNRGNR